jgi:D-alanine-D-alanine ligase
VKSAAANPDVSGSGQPRCNAGATPSKHEPPPLVAADDFVRSLPGMLARHGAAAAADSLRPPRGVVVLYSQTDKLGIAPKDEILADLETIAVAEAVAKALEERTKLEVHLVPALCHVERVLDPYPPEDYLVFNLFEGVDGVLPEDGNTLLEEEARAALTLEALGYRYTGADGRILALSTNKAYAKAALAEGGVRTPAWRTFRSAGEVKAAALHGMHFPFIVKPVAEDSSLGIDSNAVVCDLESLQARVAWVTGHYGQAVLAEEFIDGREFNVGLWGNPPRVLPLAEVDLSALGAPEKRIVTYAAKWEEDTYEYQHTPVTCPAEVADQLASSIRDAAVRAWRAVGGYRGYGRVDMRVQDEQCYVLEVNPNPSIAADAGFARAALAAGLDYAQMILTILSFAGE